MADSQPWQDALVAEVRALREDLAAQPQTQSPSRAPTQRWDPSEDAARIFPLDLTATVPFETRKDDPHKAKAELPFDTEQRINGVLIGFDDGAMGLTGLRLQTGQDERFIPRNKDGGYLAGNNYTTMLPVRAPLEPDEMLEAHYVNLDDSNSHFVTCVPVIEEVED